MTRGRIVLLFVAVACLLCIGFLYPWFEYTLQRMRLKESVAHIHTVGSVLLRERPANPESLDQVMRKLRLEPEILLDGWGRSLVVEFPAELGQPYVVRCLGRRLL